MHGDQPYLVSEYIDGPSLHDVVMRDGPRDAAERFDRMGGLVAGVGNDMRSRAAKRAFRA